MRKKSSFEIVVRRSALNKQRGILAAGPFRLPCALGRMGTTIFKREGDGASPVASLPLLSARHRRDRMVRPRALLPIRQTRSGDGWCDSSSHPAYNRPVRFPFEASAETMMRDDRLYDFVVILDWNMTSRARNRGSAIFLHIAKPGYPPTAGCVAISPKDMLRLAPLLRRKALLTIRR
ncbi:MAG: L,D-transpeptidase family protein [Fulvimarina manganoxydans]|uniref:L,D-transpeptidase family protein n=1 Tax=Fulvimarina manganoxydans TaxID=937218 RepID=UPI00235426F4|nr:L,D-transpeptidase family protein [Fulvimarina manganoxydans]MCK5931761.1 L,D-transpeptidase family protein [Fulvimarina manganoxydans]